MSNKWGSPQMKAHLSLFFPIFKKNNSAKNLKTVLTFCSSASICTVAAYICNILISLFHYILSHPLIYIYIHYHSAAHHIYKTFPYFIPLLQLHKHSLFFIPLPLQLASLKQSAGKPFHKKQVISQLSHKHNKISLEIFLNCIKHITILIIF